MSKVKCFENQQIISAEGMTAITAELWRQTDSTFALYVDAVQSEAATYVIEQLLKGGD